MNHPDDAILRIKRVRDSFGPDRPGLKETRDAIEACDWDEARTRALLIERGQMRATLEVPPIFLCERCGGTSAHSPSGFAECRSCGWTRPGEGVRAALDAAKGCWGCRYRVGDGFTCVARYTPALCDWSLNHLEDDLLTPKPGAPECPGRAER